MVSSETSASSNLGRLIASHAGNCPKIRGSLHSPIAGPGLPMITKSSSKKLSAVTRKRTAPAPEDAKVEAVGAALDAGHGQAAK